MNSPVFSPILLPTEAPTYPPVAPTAIAHQNALVPPDCKPNANVQTAQELSPPDIAQPKTLPPALPV